MPALNIILLRNTLLYFDATNKRNIMNNTRACLAPSGYIFLGAAPVPEGMKASFNPLDIDKSGDYQLKH